MFKGHHNSSPILKRVGTAASSPQTSLKVNVKVAHPLMNDVRSDDFTIKVEPPEEPFDQPKVKLSIKLQADDSVSSVLEFIPGGEEGHRLASVGDPGLLYSKNTRLQLIAGQGGESVCICTGANSDPEWMSGQGSSVFGCKSGELNWFDVRDCD